MPLSLLQSSVELADWRARNVKDELHLVPTMGGLHRGHAALIQAAAQAAASDRAPVLVSVFVNPLQFAPEEDFARYPRQLDADSALAEQAGAAALWAPSVPQIYPHGREGLTRLVPAAELVNHLCGPGRPGHFEGVCTVVSRLLALTRPSHLHLGEKDWQQLQVLRRLVNDLQWPLKVVPFPTQREPDGLPCSSRNAYLSSEQRDQVSALPAALRQAQQRVASGETCWEKLEPLLQALLQDRHLEVDYLQLVDPHRLQPLASVNGPALLAAAVRCGNARLIDHRLLMTRLPILAIDGPAGAGKSTVTRQVASALGLTFLDTGAMYRAVTWLLQQRQLPPQGGAALDQLLSELDLRFAPAAQGEQRVLVNGQDVTSEIRTAEVTAGVSAVAALPAVRHALTTQQQRLGQKGGLVAEGRDIGTAVFPDAELKIFLTATVAERARRRAADLQQRGLPVPVLAQLEQEIAERDRKDSTRSVAPLQQADDAVELLSDGLGIAEVVERILGLFRERVPLEAFSADA